MKKHLLKIFLLSLVTGSLITPLKADGNRTEARQNTYEETQFLCQDIRQ